MREPNRIGDDHRSVTPSVIAGLLSSVSARGGSQLRPPKGGTHATSCAGFRHPPMAGRVGKGRSRTVFPNGQKARLENRTPQRAHAPNQQVERTNSRKHGKQSKPESTKNRKQAKPKAKQNSSKQTESKQTETKAKRCQRPVKKYHRVGIWCGTVK